MNDKLKKIALVAAILAAGMILLLFAGGFGSAGAQEISNPHPTPPSNSITNAMLQNGIVYDANVNASAGIQASKIATSTSQDFVNDATETYTGNWQFTNYPTVPTGTPPSNGAPSLSYLQSNYVALSGGGTPIISQNGGALVTVATSTAGTVFSWTAPTGVTSVTVTISGGGGGGAANLAQGTGGSGGNMSWFGTSNATTTATSTDFILCGGGGQSASNGQNGQPGQGVNTYPDTYGGIAGVWSGTRTATAGTCYIDPTVTSVSTSTANNGGSAQVVGLGGGLATGTIAVTPGVTYYYYIGAGGQPNNNGASGATAGSSGSFTLTYSAIIGNNIAGQITATASITTGTITFAASPAWTLPPYCSVEANNAVNSAYTQTTTSTLTVVWNNTITTGQKYIYQCL